MSRLVEIESGDCVFDVAKDESILDGALRGSVPYPSGCRNGECGSCKAKLTVGETRYLDGYIPNILTTKERDQGFIVSCKATTESDITLSLPIQKVVYQAQEYSGLVIKQETIAPDIIHLVIKLPDEVLFEFHAGQFIEFILDGGQRRSFSLASWKDKDKQIIEFHIKKMPGGLFTEQLFSGSLIDQHINVFGPLGGFVFNQTGQRDVLMVAGGTGFAPIMSMLGYLVLNPPSFSVMLYRGANTLGQLYLEETIQRLSSENEWLNYIPVISSKNSNWKGRVGLVHAAVVDDNPKLDSYDVYMAGSPEMIDVASKTFCAFGLPDNQLFLDRFVPSVKLSRKALGKSIFSRVRKLMRL